MTATSASPLSQIRQYLGLIETARQGDQASLTDGTVERFQRLIAQLVVNLPDGDLAACYEDAMKSDGGAETDLFANEMQRRQSAN